MAVFLGDIVCIIGYSLIITILSQRGKTQVIGRTKEQQRKTFLLCFGVVSLFVFSSAPIMVTYFVPWNAPKWLKGLSLNLIAMNSAGNSIIYLALHYTNKTKRYRRDKEIPL